MSSNNQKTSRGRLIVLIVIGFIALTALLLPINNKKSGIEGLAKHKNLKNLKNNIKYKVLSCEAINIVGYKTSTKAKLLAVTFKVFNLAPTKNIFGAHMVNLKQGGRRYPVNEDVSLAYYEKMDKYYPLPMSIFSRSSKTITLIFIVDKSARTVYLSGYDFNATNKETAETKINIKTN